MTKNISQYLFQQNVMLTILVQWKIIIIMTSGGIIIINKSLKSQFFQNNHQNF